MSNQEYKNYVGEKEKQRPSPLLKDMLWAFVVGGLICVLGQGLKGCLLHYGVEEEAAGTWVPMVLVFLAAATTGLGLFDKLAKHAGAGTLVPITGFSNAMVSPALEFKSEGLILGTGAKMFTVAGPVLVYGVTASIVYGIIYYFIK